MNKRPDSENEAGEQPIDELPAPDSGLDRRIPEIDPTPDELPAVSSSPEEETMPNAQDYDFF